MPVNNGLCADTNGVECVRESAKTQKEFSFTSKLERIASGMEYFAISVPAKITRALKTRGPVPVAARVNDSPIFVASLYPVGNGRHKLRVRNKICKGADITEGDRVHVQATVRDRLTEVSIPNDLMRALRAKGLVEGFKALPIGKKSYLLRLIAEARKPKTRSVRIQTAEEQARPRKRPSPRRNAD